MQGELLREIKEVPKEIAFVLTYGESIDINWTKRKVKSINENKMGKIF